MTIAQALYVNHIKWQLQSKQVNSKSPPKLIQIPYPHYGDLPYNDNVFSDLSIYMLNKPPKIHSTYNSLDNREGHINCMTVIPHSTSGCVLHGIDAQLEICVLHGSPQCFSCA